jgi:benzodiazapine receptor
MSSHKSYRYLNLVFTLAVLVVNTLANALPLNGQTTGEISNRFPILFVPAGYVFSIWGLIYLGLVLFLVYQFLPASAKTPTIEEASPYYWLTCIANCAWIFLWHYEQFPATLAAMLLLLFSLIMMYRIIHREKVEYQRFIDRIPSWTFSIYLGWVSVAMIANVSQVLYYLGWDGWGISPEVWAVGLLFAAGWLGMTMLTKERDVLYNLVLVWAFVGIAQKQGGTAPVSLTAWVLAVFLAAAMIGYSLFGKKPENKIGGAG